MKALLVRVGADQTDGGGCWNGPVNSVTREFVYVPIPESKSIRLGFQKPYKILESSLKAFGRTLPGSMQGMNMHLDPDFSHLTYGDQGERAKQIRAKLTRGDLLVFYAALADIRPATRLIYAIIGLYVIDTIVAATSVPKGRWDENAHTRRALAPSANDIVVRAQSGLSGRLRTCLPIGEFRDKAYRVNLPLLKTWRGLSVHDGYLQRSARLPEILQPQRILDWFRNSNPILIAANNPK